MKYPLLVCNDEQVRRNFPRSGGLHRRVDLEAWLRVVERQTVNPVARQLLLRTLEALKGVKVGAVRMVELLELIERSGRGSRRVVTPVVADGV